MCACVCVCGGACIWNDVFMMHCMYNNGNRYRRRQSAYRMHQDLNSIGASNLYIIVWAQSNAIHIFCIHHRVISTCQKNYRISNETSSIYLFVSSSSCCLHSGIFLLTFFFFVIFCLLSLFRCTAAVVSTSFFPICLKYTKTNNIIRNNYLQTLTDSHILCLWLRDSLNTTVHWFIGA